MQDRGYFYSPFSQSDASVANHPPLLLQFILSELFQCMEDFDPLAASYAQTDAPFSLMNFQKSSPLQRIREHKGLLSFAFPHKQQEVEIFSHALSNGLCLLKNYQEHPRYAMSHKEELQIQFYSYIKQIFCLLESFIYDCRDDKNLLFFLLNSHKEIALLSQPKYLAGLLLKLHPEGSESLYQTVCDHFHERGFAFLIPKVKTLLEKIYIEHG